MPPIRPQAPAPTRGQAARAITTSLGFDECLCTEERWRSDRRLEGTQASANRRGPDKTPDTEDDIRVPPPS